MKKIILLAVIFISIHTIVYSQKDYSFEYKMHPNKTYILQMDIASSNETTVDGLMNKTESLSKVSRTTVTKDANAAGLFPAIMAFEDVSSISADGKEVLSPLSNTIIEGLMAENNTFDIDTIINPNLDKVTKDALKEVFKDLKPEIVFPKTPLKIGDNFSRDSSIKVPVHGQIIKMLTTKTYTLKSVNNTIATFSVEDNFSPETPNPDITVIGDGNGTVEFDISENQVIKDNTRFTINIRIKTINGVILGYMNSNAKKSTLIK